ncbi:MAG: tRNA (adenosine(37)-N6)-threonylcarbamoyltransferase complex dimerization subunit type 1 TsaB [Desulfarculaceae bacterium]|nr:tRNA (adenosine(37)-N6)-threonylcarbamoyltransferase complex dimerization subunit type 1 TsaB [Desulfarculaceae bacterium]MCF8071005.1 tRNA (adenosine(37)-N6)-threonylcarbamoyltransferase complex dimerization subunit type 1 TsaB [Desulfarculaceae bacterium]MCF8100593.1 tRNA (adenosine(37)-N6)-threonylcarbamoyltransferase complex dimerization subunit type 1 TsaB [Desulfarculaceae bacterium]MCF8117725.1 tRNA (adenosine(37)-N6)-threonylcarbamoyltransferase complex dimerization subunit type 1 Tsa
MLVLALDTSLSGGGAALASAGRVLAESRLEPGPGFSRRLLPAVDEVLNRTGAAPRDLEGLAVTLGPGFFTGLRVAIATAQGMALGLDLPVAGVSSLRLLAEAAPQDAETVWALADARRGLLYAAAFRREAEGLVRQEPDMAISPELLAQRIQAPALLLGPGARLLEPEQVAPGLELAPTELDQPRPGLLALLGERRLLKGQAASALELRPRYCRPSDAEVRFGLPLDEYRLVQ